MQHIKVAFKTTFYLDLNVIS